MIRTFVDCGVLIAAARGDRTESEPALRLLEDPDRQFLTSVFVRALHVAAALLLVAEEFVTTEKPGKPLCRMDAFRVVHISNFQPI